MTDAMLRHVIRPPKHLLDILAPFLLHTFVIEPAVAPISVMEDKRD